jgi:hypothetical protein
MFTKFSQFNNGGFIIPGDEIVGLRGGINTVFNAPTLQGVSWNTIIAAQSLVPQNGYFIVNIVPTVYTLPAVIPFGSIIQIANRGTSTFTIAQNAGQQIQFGDLTTTIGVGGSIASNDTGDSLTLVCNVANTTFELLGGPQGIWTVT